MILLNEYSDDKYIYREYSKDGITVSHSVKTLLLNIHEIIEDVSKPTIVEMTEANSLETQYQTLLIEMLAGI